MERTIVSLFVCILVVSSFVSFASAHEETDEDELEVFGFELENVLILLGGWLSLFLFVISFVAYRRDGRTRLLYISIGFLLFALKNFMISSELFVGGYEWVDPAAVVLEFVALLSFFYGVLKK